MRQDPGRPFITFYDDATGERVEISRATTMNWVAKTANLLADEFDVQPGDRVGFDLPAHWQTAVSVLAVWWLGAVVTAPDAATNDLHLCSTGSDEASRGRCDLSFSLLPLGRPGEPPANGIDYAAEVPGQPDLPPPNASAADQPAVDLPGLRAGHTELLALAEQRAEAYGSGGARVLTTSVPSTYPGILDVVVVPLATAGSCVLCRHLDEAAVGRRMQDERAEVRL